LSGVYRIGFLDTRWLWRTCHRSRRKQIEVARLQAAGPFFAWMHKAAVDVVAAIAVLAHPRETGALGAVRMIVRAGGRCALIVVLAVGDAAAARFVVGAIKAVVHANGAVGRARLPADHTAICHF